MFGAAQTTAHPVDIGQRSEAAIISELVRRGYKVLLPFGFNNRYDLVIEDGDDWVRVQCKTGRLRNGCVVWSTRSVRSNMHGSVTAGYEGEIDVFMIFCPEMDRVYCVPVEEASRGAASLRVDPPANGQSRGIRWASDYELPT